MLHPHAPIMHTSCHHPSPASHIAPIPSHHTRIPPSSSPIPDSSTGYTPSPDRRSDRPAKKVPAPGSLTWLHTPHAYRYRPHLSYTHPPGSLHCDRPSSTPPANNPSAGTAPSSIVK